MKIVSKALKGSGIVLLSILLTVHGYGYKTIEFWLAMAAVLLIMVGKDFQD